MKNKIVIIGVIILLIIFVGVGSLLGYRAYQQWRIANAEIIVENGSIDDVSIIKIKEIAVEHTGYTVDKISITEMEY